MRTTPRHLLALADRARSRITTNPCQSRGGTIPAINRDSDSEVAGVSKTHRLLEIGTRSGYDADVLGATLDGALFGELPRRPRVQGSKSSDSWSACSAAPISSTLPVRPRERIGIPRCLVSGLGRFQHEIWSTGRR
jgi:hypothetical protein